MVEGRGHCGLGWSERVRGVDVLLKQHSGQSLFEPVAQIAFSTQMLSGEPWPAGVEEGAEITEPESLALLTCKTQRALWAVVRVRVYRKLLLHSESSKEL